MTHSLRTLFLALALLPAVVGSAYAADNRCFRILPLPQSVSWGTKNAWHWHELQVIRLENGAVRPCTDMVRRLRKKGEGRRLLLRLTTRDTPQNEEGYRLTVDREGAVVTSRSNTGLFYGCQTLRQLLEDSRDFGCPIPEVTVTDYPTIAYRAVHLDTKHHLDRMEYYYRMIDKLASYKVNAVIWELEDKLRYTRNPEIGAPNAISKQEMQSLCRYARERHIDVSPLVQGLGHAGYILKHHPELRENPQSDWEFCPSNPKTYDMQFSLYAEAMEAMPYGKYLHVGGDELYSVGVDERCKAMGKSPFELQMEWLGKVCRYAREHGRTPIFWDDMPLKYGGVYDLVEDKNISADQLARQWNTDRLDSSVALFPKDCVYMRWNYENAEIPGNRKILDWYAGKGISVMGATAASFGESPFLPRNNTQADAIRSFCRLIGEHRLGGILATAWDDCSPHLETVWRGYIALAEYGWNPQGRNVDTFKQVHAQREFGFRAQDNRMAFLDDLERSFFFFDEALSVSGRRNPGWGIREYAVIELPDSLRPGAWTGTYAEKIKRAVTEDSSYRHIKKGIEEARDLARRNSYTLRIYEQLNELQHYPTRLLLALAAYDSDPSRDNYNKVKAVAESFGTMRHALEKVYGETRFLRQPEGYIEDSNFANHLSAKSPDNDWMFLYEIPVTEKVLQYFR